MAYLFLMDEFLLRQSQNRNILFGGGVKPTHFMLSHPMEGWEGEMGKGAWDSAQLSAALLTASHDVPCLPLLIFWKLNRTGQNLVQREAGK